MARTYYAQSDHRVSTLTVGALIEQLSKLDPTKPVIFRSPLYGAFGPSTAYSIERALAEHLPASSIEYPATEYEDEETGQLAQQEAYSQHFLEWDGVVIE